MLKYYVRKKEGMPVLGPWASADLAKIKRSGQITDSWEAIEDDGSGIESVSKRPSHLWSKVADIHSEEIPLGPGQWFQLGLNGQLRGPVAPPSAADGKPANDRLDWTLFSLADESGCLSVWRPACILKQGARDGTVQQQSPQGLSEFLSRFEGSVIGVAIDNLGTVVAKRCILSTADMVVVVDLDSFSNLVIPHHRIESIAANSIYLPLNHRDLRNLHSANGLNPTPIVEVPLVITIEAPSRTSNVSQVLLIPAEAPQPEPRIIWGVGFGISVPFSF